MAKQHFVVAVKDTTTGTIRPGKILAKFKKIESVYHTTPKGDTMLSSLANKEGVPLWRVGVFNSNNNLIE